MQKPFDLPEGLEWCQPDDSDRSWWCGNGKGSHPMGNGVPFENVASMSITFRLRHVSTGEERTITDSCGMFDINDKSRTPDERISAVAFFYTEGNLGCGCNRRILWAEAGGEPRPDDESNICNDEFELIGPAWLVECDENPWARQAELPPWRRAS